jgi:membrane protein
VTTTHDTRTRPVVDARQPLGPDPSAWEILRQTAKSWSTHNVPRLGAALAYYTVFSLPGVLLISLAIAGAVFGEEAANGRVREQLGSLLGEEGANAIDQMLASARQPDKGLIASIVGVMLLVFAASGVFGELQTGLNVIWSAEPAKGAGLWGTIRNRFLSVAMVLGTGFLLLVSLVLSALLSVLGAWFGDLIPGPDLLLQVANQGISFVVITLLFAMIFKFLPDVEIRWRDVWIGAAVTALLFSIGKFAIGFYLGHAAVGSAYGAAGSLVAVLVWVYYSAQILYAGAEFTQVYARTFASRIRTDSAH